MIEAIGGIVIGLCLGLLGSGGSILTVPVLVYLLQHDPKAAIAESLAIVGGIALVGAIEPALRKRIDWPSILFFGLPGVGGTVLGAWVAQYMSGVVQLVIFSVVMLLAAGLMFRGRSEAEDAPTDRTLRDYGLIVIEGLGVGALTGIVGVGGGFLIVPALVLLGRLPMRIAVGTSLLIIAAKSGAGFFEYHGQMVEAGVPIAWKTIGVFIALGAIGTLVGGAIGGRLPQQRLKQVFAVFLIVMGAVILVKEGRKLIAIDDEVDRPVEHAGQIERRRPDLPSRPTVQAVGYFFS
jgi:uncharacterized membrane protein YfcA